MRDNMSVSTSVLAIAIRVSDVVMFISRAEKLNVVYIDGKAVCQTPVVPLELRNSALLHIPIELTVDGNEFFAAGAVFTFYQLPVLTMISPIFGSEVGGTTVILRGNHFLPDFGRGHIKCLFGTDQSVADL